MPDSLPPNGGPSPNDGWDLEGLLSGENVWVPEGMRPVAVTLAVLRSAPARAELAGEATARAMFRQIMVARESTPARSGGETGDARTLVLQTPAADGGPHLVARPRHSHRRPPRPRRWRWQSKALVGAAAAAVVIAGTALAGTFSGAGGPPGQPGRGPGVTSATSQPAGSAPVANGLEGSATNEAAPSVSDSQHSSSGPGAALAPDALCRQYWAFFSHPESPASVKAENDNLQQLSALAGGLWNVNRYCTAYAPLSPGPPAPGSNPGGPDFQDPGSTQGPQGKNSSGQHGGDGTGNGGTGNGGDGTGNGSNGSGNSSNGTGNGSNGTGNGSNGTGNGSKGSGQGGKSSGAGGLQ
jgi:hypothetical protein